MTTTKTSGNYSGMERRRTLRRTKNEQRDLVRWEPEQPVRRHGNGRRVSDGLRYPR